MEDSTAEKPKIKFNPAVLVHSIERKPLDFRTLGPMTIADLNKELANIDKNIEFIAHTSDKDHLLDAFLQEKETNSESDSQNTQS